MECFCGKLALKNAAEAVPQVGGVHCPPSVTFTNVWGDGAHLAVAVEQCSFETVWP